MFRNVAGMRLKHGRSLKLGFTSGVEMSAIVVFAPVCALLVGVLLLVLMRARSADRMELAQVPVETVLSPGPAAAIDRISDERTIKILGSVMEELKESAADVANSVEAPDPVRASRPRSRSRRVTSRRGGQSTTLELQPFLNGEAVKPVILRDFDSDADRLLVVAPGARAVPAMKLSKTTRGTPVLCCGAATVALMPGLKGSSPIDMLMV